jgi:hypothetical protein
VRCEGRAGQYGHSCACCSVQPLAGGRGINNSAASWRTLQRARLAARVLEHSAQCASDQRTARDREQRDSAAVSGWRILARALCSSDRSKAPRGDGVIFSRGKAPSINQLPALRRETFQRCPARASARADNVTSFQSQRNNHFPLMHHSRTWCHGARYLPICHRLLKYRIP